MFQNVENATSHCGIIGPESTICSWKPKDQRTIGPTGTKGYLQELSLYN